MSNRGVQKRIYSKSSSSERRKEYLERLDPSSLLIMVACPECLERDVVCVAEPKQTKCNNCIKLGIVCGGTFSPREFDKLQEKRKMLEKRRHALIEAISELPKELQGVERQITSMKAKEENMLAREGQALAELGELGDPEALNFDPEVLETQQPSS